MGDFLGLLIECVILYFAWSIYLFSIGRKKVENNPQLQWLEDFRLKSGGLLRIMALAIMAIMFLNIVLHLKDIFSA